MRENELVLAANIIQQNETSFNIITACLGGFSIIIAVLIFVVIKAIPVGRKDLEKMHKIRKLFLNK